MGRILARVRIPLAVLGAAAFIIGAYLLARGVGVPPAARASAETALLQAIAARDSDSDGLPDWEETLYGTDAANPDSFHLGMKDGEAVAKGLIVPKALADISTATSSAGSASFDPSLPLPPAEGSLTAAFSKNFLAAYLAAKQAKGGASLSQNDVNAIANEVLDSLSKSIVTAPDFKSAKDLTISGSGPDALKAFAVSAEAVLMKNTSNATTSELNYLQSALENNDSTALPHIASIAKGYRGSALGLAVLPVPQELAETDLMLINALMRTSEVTSDFARINTDPLATMLALYQYPYAVGSLAAAFIGIGQVYEKAGVTLSSGKPGASFVNLVADALANKGISPNKP